MHVTNFRTLPELLRVHARQADDRAAIAAPGRSPLSHVGLLGLVEQCAAVLAGSGITRNDRVAIVLPNGPEMATSFLAVASTCTAAPLNPSYTAAELEFYLTDLRARAVVVEEGSSSPAVDVARALGIAVLPLAMEHHAAGAFRLGSTSPPRITLEGARPEDVALVLHTSGTTSRPKIVPLTHSNLCASAANISTTLSLTAADRCLNVMPLFHIHGLIAAVLSSLAAGGSVCCTPGFRAEDLVRCLDDERPTWFTAVPTIHQAILTVLRSGGGPPPPGLRFIRSASAPLPPQVMLELEARLGVPVIEAYGMTEGAHQIASNPLPPLPRIPGSVGVPIGVEMVILDAAGTVLGVGERGEVAIRGPNVITGYEGNADANASSFSNGFLRTGDVGWLNDAGRLFLTGRLKEIINRGGEKIAPGEVDMVLLEHAAVFQAVAFGVPHPTLGEDIVAAVVLRPGALVTEVELRDLVAARLASFKVPSRFLFVAEIPKGATGKLQRRALAELMASQLATPIMPRTPTERLLAQVWSEILGLERVGIRDNFSAVGGDSLRATVIVARAEQVGLSFDPQLIFEHPTIEELAKQIDSRPASYAL